MCCPVIKNPTDAQGDFAKLCPTFGFKNCSSQTCLTGDFFFDPG